MSIELTLIIALIFHFTGDYLTQNHWLATNKTSSSFVALIHVIIYSLPFLFITSLSAVAIILITHFFIDRFRLAQYWIKLVNWNWKSTNFGYAEDIPKFLSIWLMIIVDNTFHIIINSLSIYYLT
jgi:hypothetical protein